MFARRRSSGALSSAAEDGGATACLVPASAALSAAAAAAFGGVTTTQPPAQQQLTPRTGSEALALPLKACMLAEADVALGRLLGQGTQVRLRCAVAPCRAACTPSPSRSARRCWVHATYGTAASAQRMRNARWLRAPRARDTCTPLLRMRIAAPR
jgi:hypothetical protein